jgi:hypothetical protein
MRKTEREREREREERGERNSPFRQTYPCDNESTPMVATLIQIY